MSYKCAKCDGVIKKTQTSIFHRFAYYNVSCLKFSKEYMAQVIRK